MSVAILLEIRRYDWRLKKNKWRERKKLARKNSDGLATEISVANVWEKFDVPYLSKRRRLYLNIATDVATELFRR